MPIDMTGDNGFEKVRGVYGFVDEVTCLVCCPAKYKKQPPRKYGGRTKRFRKIDSEILFLIDYEVVLGEPV